MSKKIFIDSDIILDVLCKREPFYTFSAEIFTLGDKRKVKLLTTPVVFANIFYISRKLLGVERAKEALRKLRLIIDIMPIGEKIIDLSLNSKFTDFEDALQYFTAREHQIKILLTRNTKDYKEKDLLVQTPEEYIKSSS